VCKNKEERRNNIYLRIQGFKDSKIQEFKNSKINIGGRAEPRPSDKLDSRIQGFKDSKIQKFKLEGPSP